MTNFGLGKTLRVANIIEEGRLGGPQTRIANIASRLIEMEIETTVLLPDAENRVFVEKLERLGIAYQVLPLTRLKRNKLDVLAFLVKFPADVLRVRKAIRTSGADVVHCNSSGQWKGILAARLAGVPALWHLNDTNMPGFVVFVFRIFAGLAAGFIPAAQRVADYYLQNRLPGIPRFFIQAPIDCNLFGPDVIEPDKKIKQISGLKIGLVGNVNTDKDIMTYVAMAHLLRAQQGDQISCFQVGGQFETQKNYIAQVKALNQQNETPAVTMLGIRKDVRSFLRSIDIYVCSSQFEASPISVWEAMAMGLPIVTTDVGDIAQMNETGNFAIVVPTRDPEALAGAVSKLVDLPDERRRLGANARKFALDNLDIKICVRNHANAYRAIIDANTSK